MLAVGAYAGCLVTDRLTINCAVRTAACDLTDCVWANVVIASLSLSPSSIPVLHWLSPSVEEFGHHSTPIPFDGVKDEGGNLENGNDISFAQTA